MEGRGLDGKWQGGNGCLVGLGLYRRIENQLFFFISGSNEENAYHPFYLGNTRQK